MYFDDYSSSLVIMELHLTVFKFPPLVSPKIITSSPKVVMVNEGDNLTLTCEATGVPPPAITWFKGGRSLPGETLFVRQAKTSRLHFESTSYKDRGIYRCEARNVVGKTSVNIQVIFKGEVTKLSKVLQALPPQSM